MLTHPLEPLVPLQAEEGGSDLAPVQGERIVWSSIEVPYIATHNQVGCLMEGSPVSVLISHENAWRAAHMCRCGCERLLLLLQLSEG